MKCAGRLREKLGKDAYDFRYLESLRVGIPTWQSSTHYLRQVGIFFFHIL